jgi:lipopolysaccharide biosynthesis protein
MAGRDIADGIPSERACTGPTTRREIWLIAVDTTRHDHDVNSRVSGTGGATPDAPRARVIAMYLPQYHPIPENDRFWGRGFTEWTNVTKAKPLFPGHLQPNLPSDLGFYDLRVPEVRDAQAELARDAMVEGFCYYHYWFGNGRRVLERPFDDVLASRQPTLSFCLCWANESWSGVWHGAPDQLLIEQTYPGLEDAAAHFECLLTAFRDTRYVRVDGKPLFVFYRPEQIPDLAGMVALWRKLAREANLPGLHLLGNYENGDFDPASGLDGWMRTHMPRRVQWVSRRRTVAWLRHWYARQRGWPLRFDYRELAAAFTSVTFDDREYPVVMPNWDNTPRSAQNGMVYENADPERFRVVLRHAIESVRRRPSSSRLVFLKSWNEWAEGNYVEPDVRFGRAWLTVLRDELTGRN